MATSLVAGYDRFRTFSIIGYQVLWLLFFNIISRVTSRIQDINIERERMKSSSVYGVDYTMRGNITKEQKTALANEIIRYVD
jgi:hypothetical protein